MSQQPRTLPVNPDGIPAELRSLPRWVCWRWERRDGRWTKVPISPHTGHPASVTGPATWATFAAAMAAYERHHYAGVGLVLAGDGLACIDLDKCRRVDGTLTTEATAIVGRLASYTELSPSGAGVHIWLRGRIPGPRRRRGAIEVYDDRRFIAVTGHALPGTPAMVMPRQDELAALYREFLAEPEPAPSPNGHSSMAWLTDGEIIRLASEAANGAKFRALFFDGDVSSYDGDDSAADMALAASLAFYSRDPAQIERLLSRSALGQREKWRNRADYRERTVAKALQTVTERYTPPGSGPRLVVSKEPGSSPPPLGGPAPWPEMDAAAFYGLGGDVVRACEAHTEADPVAILATFLALFGSACGRTPHLWVGDVRHGANLYIALAGDTAKSRKGSSRGGPQRIVVSADPGFADRIISGLGSGEGLIWSIRDPVTTLDRKTGEERVTDPGVEDKRLLVIEEELAAVLRVCERQGSTLSPVLRRAWDSPEQLQVVTKNAPARASNPHVSVLAHITVDEVRRSLTESEAANGLGNRFLWLAVRRSKCLPRPAPLPTNTVSDLARRVQRALAFARRCGPLGFDDEAAEAWDGLYPELSDAKPGLAGALMARMEAHALRLAAIYALLDQSQAIRLPHLTAALAVVDYAEASIRHIWGDATGDAVADRVLAALRAGGPLTQNEIADLFGRHVPASRLGRAMEVLLSTGRVRSHREETGGRPRTIWEAAS